MLTEFAPAILALSILLPYPPGPAPKGFISGNKSDISTPYAWRRYSELAKEHGNILHLQTFGKHIIILNSVEDSARLLEQRSRNYSSRPVMPMADLMGFANTSTSLRIYGPEWRAHRKMFQQSFKPDSCLAYRPIQTEKMHEMLRELLHTPEDFKAHIHTFAGAIILSVTYGYNAAPKDDPYVSLVEPVLEAFRAAPSPKWRVNSLPLLRYIPSWFPGAGFKRYANSVRQQLQEQRESTFTYAAASPMASESPHTSVVASLLKTFNSDMDVTLLKEAAASAYTAGVGTTASSIIVFLVAMVAFPEIQKKAQAEIDCVTGGQRLPEYDDQSSLPYIQAVVREVIRWQPSFPLGLPHTNNEDDVYNGYYIPKGSIIYSNIWAMTRNPVKYKDPEIFNPERFFTENGNLNDDEVTYVFGFGRRICPGRHLGMASIWLAIASILSTFDIKHKKDPYGEDIPVEVSYKDHRVTNAPIGLQCSMTPRSEKARQIILGCHGEV